MPLNFPFVFLLLFYSVIFIFYALQLFLQNVTSTTTLLSLFFQFSLLPSSFLCFRNMGLFCDMVWKKLWIGAILLALSYLSLTAIEDSVICKEKKAKEQNFRSFQRDGESWGDPMRLSPR